MLSSKKSRTIFIGVFLVLIAAVCSWFFLLSPQLSTDDDLNAQADIVESKNIVDTNSLKELISLAKKAPAAAKRAQDLFVKMPYTINPSDALVVFEDVAAKAGIQSEQIQTLSAGIPTPLKTTKSGSSAKLPGVGDTGGAIAEISISMTITGTEDQFNSLMKSLEEMDRIFIVNTVSLSRKETEDTVSSQIKGSMFVLQSQLPDIVGQVDALLENVNDDIKRQIDAAPDIDTTLPMESTDPTVNNPTVPGAVDNPTVPGAVDNPTVPGAVDNPTVPGSPDQTTDTTGATLPVEPTDTVTPTVAPDALPAP